MLSTKYSQIYFYLFLIIFNFFIVKSLNAKTLFFRNRELQAHELMEYSLIVSGSEENQNLLKIYTKLAKESFLIEYENLKKNKILNLLYFLHNNFLSDYDYYQTKMDVLLETGAYNCVSLSLLYAALLRELGLKAYLLGSFEHTKVVLQLAEGNWLIVETTDKNAETWEFTRELKEEPLSDNQALALILRNLLFIAQKKEQGLQVLLSLQTDLADLSGLEKDYNNLFELQVAYSLEKYARGGIFETLSFLDKTIEVYQAERLKKVRSKFIYNEIVTKFNNKKFAESKRLYYLFSLKMEPEHLRKIAVIFKL